MPQIARLIQTPTIRPETILEVAASIDAQAKGIEDAVRYGQQARAEVVSAIVTAQESMSASSSSSTAPWWSWSPGPPTARAARGPALPASGPGRRGRRSSHRDLSQGRPRETYAVAAGRVRRPPRRCGVVVSGLVYGDEVLWSIDEHLAEFVGMRARPAAARWRPRTGPGAAGPSIRTTGTTATATAAAPARMTSTATGRLWRQHKPGDRRAARRPSVKSG